MGIIAVLLVANGVQSSPGDFMPDWTVRAWQALPSFDAADAAFVPLWVVLVCHLAMGLGTLTGGWRIVKTMGSRITELKPQQGFCAETGGAICLFYATNLGVPVSTTHTITGAIMGVGALSSRAKGPG